MYEFNHIPIKIMELDRECYANIEVDEIMLTSYPPQYKTIVTIELDFILLCEKFYTVQIKNDIPRKYYAGNMSNKLIMCEMDDRTLSEWEKAIINSEKHDKENPCYMSVFPKTKSEEMIEKLDNAQENLVKNQFDIDEFIRQYDRYELACIAHKIINFLYEGENDEHEKN